MKKPVNDLSRGCLVADIVNTVAITAVQAQADKMAAQYGFAKAIPAYKNPPASMMQGDFCKLQRREG